MSNVAWIKSESGGIKPVMIFDKGLLPKVERFIARRDLQNAFDPPTRCVIPEYDGFLNAPIERVFSPKGYSNIVLGLLSVVSGWHFLRPKRYLYYATNEGLRLIAEHGDPHKAYASL